MTATCSGAHILGLLERGQHRLGGGLQFVGLQGELGAGADLALAALQGSLTPSMVNISSPIRCCWSHRYSTWAKTWLILLPSVPDEASDRGEVRLGITG